MVYMYITNMETDCTHVNVNTCAAQEELDRAFDAMDANQNGTVDAAEFEAWWEAKGGWEYAQEPSLWE